MPGECACLRGVCARGACVPRVCACPGDHVCPGGMCAWGVCMPRGPCMPGSHACPGGVHAPGSMRAWRGGVRVSMVGGGATHAPRHREIRLVNARPVRILLECIIVYCLYCVFFSLFTIQINLGPEIGTADLHIQTYNGRCRLHHHSHCSLLILRPHLDRYLVLVSVNSSYPWIH